MYGMMKTLVKYNQIKIIYGNYIHNEALERMITDYCSIKVNFLILIYRRAIFLLYNYETTVIVLKQSIFVFIPSKQ